jgi:hypothetical protein
MTMLNWKEQSPFVPLGAHMDKVRTCVDLVVPMFVCIQGGDFEKLKTLAAQVFRSEHEADTIKREIRQSIPTTFSLPVYRGDLLAYLHIQDDIADSVEDIAVMVTIKNLAMPETLRDDIFAYVQRVVEVCEFLFQATDQLKTLTEDEFFGPSADQVMEIIAKADHAEWEADKAQYRLAQRLFALDDELKPTDIFLWSGIMRELGTLANNADKTGERLRRMLGR